jgi:rhodanese-related sulfurtransferase
MIRKLTLRGAGVGVIDRRVAASSVESGRLVHVLPQWCLAPAPLHLLTPSRLMSALVRLFREFLVEPTAGAKACSNGGWFIVFMLRACMKKLWLGLVFLSMSACTFAKDVIVDVRTPQEYAAGHVDGAINIEYGAIGQEISKVGISKEDKVLLYCQTGRRSGIALTTLKSLGFSKAENVGGIEQARKSLQKP